mgnify:FL=1
MNKADSSRALLILALICTAYLLIPFHRMTPSIMSAAIMAETGMGPVMIGFLSSILFLTFGIMQMVGGLLVDSYGPRRILPCFLLAATAGTALFALSTSAPGLLLGRAIIGFGTSVIFVSGLKLFNAWFPPTVYARLNGLLLGMGGLGLVIGSGGMGYLCDGLGWRTSHLIVALITFCFALALAWIVRDTPGHASRPTPAGRAGAAPLALLGHILRNRQFLFIAGWFCCQFSLHNAFGGLWGGQYLRAIYHLDTVTTGNVLNMLGIGTLLGSLANAWLCDRFFRTPRTMMPIAAAAYVLLFAVLIFWGAGFSIPVLCAWFFLLAFFGMGSLSAGFACMPGIFGSALLGTASGLLNTLPSLVVLLLQPLTGLILASCGDAGGSYGPHDYAVALSLYLVLSVVSLLCALAAWGRPEQRES